MHQIHLESEDFAVQPFEVLTAPTGPAVGTGGIQAPEAPWYPVNCPVNGGDRLSFYGLELVPAGATATASMSCQIILSDKKAGGQYHAKVGTSTAVGAAGIHTPESESYTITGGHTLEEIYGALMVDGVTVETSMGYFEFRSNDFQDPTPLKLPTNPIAACITDGGVGMNGIARSKVEVGILSPCKITGSTTLETVSAGDFVTGVLYR